MGIITIGLASKVSLRFSRMLNDVSVASLMNSDKSTIIGFILSKLDILTIWAYIVFSIGLSKMFKSVSTGKYYAMVFGVWIIGTFILFILSKSIPFLQNFQ